MGSALYWFSPLDSINDLISFFTVANVFRRSAIMISPKENTKVI